MNDWEKGETDRGFRLYSFKDKYGKRGELQMSSIADYEAVWLGYAGDQERHPVTKELLTCRLHLDRATARKIGMKLIAFAETGELP